MTEATPKDPGSASQLPSDTRTTEPPEDPKAAADPRTVVFTRRKLLIGGATLLAAGSVAGGAAILATGGLRSPQAGPGPAAAPGGPGPTAPGQTSVPAGILPTPVGATEEPIEDSPPLGPGRAKAENERRGSRRWELPLTDTGDAEGYVSDTSVAQDEQIRLHLSSSLPRVTVTLYRLGWYGGAGARVVARWKDVPVDRQPPPTTNARTGLTRAAWSPAVTATVPGGWVSGLYVAVLSPAGGAPQYCSFVVRETQPTAPILFVSAATTHQAYNLWGGKSLYPAGSSGGTTIAGDVRAVMVSMDRPYMVNRGAGLILRWEYQFVRWMESRGYDVGYIADLDLDRHPELLATRSLIVFAGHPEYWSVPMRRNLEAAIAAGTNVAFFSANEMAWRIRFEDLAGGPYRSVTCYKQASLDPLASSDPVHATVEWRSPPAADPESKVIGEMYGHIVLAPAAFVCSAPDHWLYAGTGMRAGDAIANLVGQEYDRYWPGPGLAPAGTQILATSPVRPRMARTTGGSGSTPTLDPAQAVANATIYTAPSGATVFAAGTIQWSWGLDDWGSPTYEGHRTPVDPRVAVMTANVLDRLGS